MLLATLAGFVYWQWASQPLWSLERDLVSYHCHDINRQEVVLYVRHQGEHYLETRQLRTGMVLKQKKLPVLDNRTYALPNALAEHREDALVILGQLLIPSGKVPTLTVNIYERGTGRVITPSPIECQWPRFHQAYGNKAAICTKDGLQLFEAGKSEHRHIPVENALSVRFLPGSNLMVCVAGTLIHVFEWSTGKLLYTSEPTSNATYIECKASGEIIISRGEPNNQTSIERRRWDGRKLVITTHRVFLTKPLASFGMISSRLQFEDDAGRLHTAPYVGEEVPAPWRDWIPWLKDKVGLSLGKYYDKKTLYHWYVLRSDNTVERQYEGDSGEVHSLGGSSHLLVKTRYDNATKTQSTFVLSTIPAWPNALAISLTVYLLLYVYRHRRHRV
ncbi:MAG TPA: hypothetical protein PLX97_08290 [Gemmatales bacterium]|nr:hypothetical protein [Gemmatales bacterium]